MTEEVDFVGSGAILSDVVAALSASFQMGELDEGDADCKILEEAARAALKSVHEAPAGAGTEMLFGMLVGALVMLDQFLEVFHGMDPECQLPKSALEVVQTMGLLGAAWRDGLRPDLEMGDVDGLG